MIVEAALALSGLPYEVEEISYGEPGPQRDRLLAFNPLGQVPTLLLPDGRTMTESAAIILHLADEAPHAGLAPAAQDATRPMFLRWLAFIVAAIYPTFTYGDEPARWTGDGRASQGAVALFRVAESLQAVGAGRAVQRPRPLCGGDDHVAARRGLVQAGKSGACRHRRARRTARIAA
jgi:glutathione S-transferase